MISTKMSEISFTERDITPKASPEAIDKFDGAIISWQVLQHFHLSHYLENTPVAHTHTDSSLAAAALG